MSEKPKTNEEIFFEAMPNVKGRKYTCHRFGRRRCLKLMQLAREAGKQGIKDEVAFYIKMNSGTTAEITYENFKTIKEGLESKCPIHGAEDRAKLEREAEQRGALNLVNELRGEFFKVGMTARYMDESEFRQGQNSVLTWLERRIKKYGVE